MAQHGGEDTIRIARIDRQRRNLLPVNQTEMSPGLARIRRFVDAIAYRKIGSVQSLAAADVNDVRIGGGHGDRTDRLRRLVVEDRVPRAPVVVRFPYPAVHLRHVENIRLAGHASGGARSATAKRPNHAPAQVLISILRNLRPTRGGKKEKNKNKNTNQTTKTDSQ